jgi:invasion protein IalB
MKKIVPPSTTSIWAIAAIFLFANAPGAFATAQKKPTGSGQEKPDPLVNAAMKNMEAGVWSVNGTVMAKKRSSCKVFLPAKILIWRWNRA